MAVEALKTTAITNLDASPIVANTAGYGAPAILHSVDGYITVSAAASTTSTYRMVRLPTKAIVKHLFFESQAQGAGKFNLSAYYSDSATDGTSVANQGVIVPTTGDQFWASDIDCAAAVVSADYINESGNYPVNKRQKQLWDALGLTSDPGGFIDVVAVVHTTAVTTGTGNIYVDCQFVY
jgi:hypothetical protein